MYAFPSITLPKKAIDAATEAGQPADVFYAFNLLESTGICIIPGSGFGQKPETFHFRYDFNLVKIIILMIIRRTTILPQKDMIKEMLGRLKEFHVKFTAEYS